MNKRKLLASNASLLFIGLITHLFFVSSCQRFDPEIFLEVETNTIEPLPDKAYKFTGSIASLGQDEVIQHGFCWSENNSPTTAGEATELGQRDNKGSFSSTESDFASGTKYYVRAYATTEKETEYGEEKSFTTPLVEPPAASFTGSPTSIDEGDSVQFTDQSTNTPTSWSWDFGDGQSSTQEHPSHIYTSAGTYSVSLTVSNSGGQDTETKTNYITVNNAGSAPEAAFTGSPTTISEGQSVQFTDQSTNTPTSWTWDFGDGQTSTQQHPSHIYTSEGSYTVTLTVTNSFGQDAETRTDYITVNAVGNPPVAAFTGSHTNIFQGESVQFTDQSANTPTSWSWNFGDGQTSMQRHPSHIYSTEGVFTVSLTATNSFGQDIETKQDYIIVEKCMGCETGYVSDVDGNTYNTVRIGNQWWMAENLKVTQYADEITPIENVNTVEAWGSLSLDAKAYCWYNDDVRNKDIYGALYTWAAAMNGANSSNTNPSGVQGVCPDGWHLPSDEEWKELEMTVGLTQAEADATSWRGTDEGGKLKSVSSLWTSPNVGATNESGFSALPGGLRGDAGWFERLGEHARFYTSTDNGGDWAWRRILADHSSQIHRFAANEKNAGFAVRCVRD